MKKIFVTAAILLAGSAAAIVVANKTGEHKACPVCPEGKCCKMAPGDQCSDPENCTFKK